MPTRRDFLKTSAAAAAAVNLRIARSAYAAGSDTLRVGLVGCGGRGTGAAGQALAADRGLKLVAMGDAFEDRLKQSLEQLGKNRETSAKIDVAPERRFVGFDAYKGVIEASDVVLLATPPQFRPLHLRAAIEAGKHVFAEKPVAVDAPGVRGVLETCEAAKKKNLSVVSGLCLRYDNSFREGVRRIHDGAIGELRTLQANDYRGRIWVKPRQPGMTDMEWQMRNWYYFTWLSGDFNVEQHVHYLDVCTWLMRDQYPVSAVGMGGRQARTGPEYGQIYDHHSVVYEYANGVRLFSNCRQQQGCHNDMSAHAFGSKGYALVAERRMQIGDWTWDGPKNNMYQTEHDELFRAIRDGKTINNGEYMAKSTLVAIMGRMATYTGALVTWEQALNSKEDLTPPAYDWKIPLTQPAIAIPGVTKLT